MKTTNPFSIAIRITNTLLHHISSKKTALSIRILWEWENRHAAFLYFILLLHMPKMIHSIRYNTSRYNTDGFYASCGKITVSSILKSSFAYTACGIVAGITIASPA